MCCMRCATTRCTRCPRVCMPARTAAPRQRSAAGAGRWDEEVAAARRKAKPAYDDPALEITRPAALFSRPPQAAACTVCQMSDSSPSPWPTRPNCRRGWARWSRAWSGRASCWTASALRFDTKHAPDGIRWLPLAPSTRRQYAGDNTRFDRRVGRREVVGRGSLPKRTRHTRNSLTHNG